MKPFHKPTFGLLLLLTAAFFIPQGAASVEGTRVLVIVKADSPLGSFNLKGIQAIYLGEKLYVGSDKIEPLVNGDEATAEIFFKKILNKTKGQFKKIWTSKAFVDGLAAPATLPSGNDVLRVVEKNEDAIGFISEKDLTPNYRKTVRVLFSVGASDK